MATRGAELGMIGPARAQSMPKSANLPTIKPGANTSFSLIKHVDAGALNGCHAEAGPADGPTVVLLHGWPYDFHSYLAARTSVAMAWSISASSAMVAKLAAFLSMVVFSVRKIC
jgi:hypothetical protein